MKTGSADGTRTPNTMAVC